MNILLMAAGMMGGRLSGGTLLPAEEKEVDFFIHYLTDYELFGHRFYLTTTQVSLVLVSLLLIIFSVVAGRKLKKPDEIPGVFQNILELIVDMLDRMADGIMGANARRFGNYISSIFLFILISNLSGLLGLRPPTADYGVTLALGLITFSLIHINGIRKNKVKHFTAFFQPIFFLFPLNIIGEMAVPLSLSLRLFGNILSGTVLMGLIYGLTPLWAHIGIPAALHVYLDIFSGCIQTYVFCMLTMVFVTDKISD